MMHESAVYTDIFLVYCKSVIKSLAARCQDPFRDFPARSTRGDACNNVADRWSLARQRSLGFFPAPSPGNETPTPLNVKRYSLKSHLLVNKRRLQRAKGALQRMFQERNES